MRFQGQEITKDEYIRVLEAIVTDILDGEDIGDIRGMTGLSEERCKQIYQQKTEIMDRYLKDVKPEPDKPTVEAVTIESMQKDQTVTVDDVRRRLNLSMKTESKGSDTKIITTLSWDEKPIAGDVVIITEGRPTRD
jgi:hypothetical protein